MGKALGLFVGLNYAGTDSRLSGCINDALDWAGRADVFGVRDAAQTVGESCTSRALLFEDDATKAGIIKAVESIYQKLSAGDWFVWQFSGHGTYARDNDGDEVDGRDEALCPWDMKRNLFFDDEIYALLSRRPAGVKVLLITDCCHSGTMTRNTEAEGEPRFVPFRQLSDEAVNGEHDLRRGSAPLDEVVHISGCKDSEVSYDARFGGRANGAMSYFAIRAYRSLPRGGTFRQWFKALSESIRNSQYKQTPQINASDAALDWEVPGRELIVAPPPADAVDSESKPPGPMTVEFGGWRGVVSDWKKTG